MNNNYIDKLLLLNTVKKHPGITTPELAEVLGVSVSRARWAVHQCSELQFNDGNCIRFKAGEEIKGIEQSCRENTKNIWE